MVVILSKKALEKTEDCLKNFDIDANDQTKQEPEPEIGTENQHEPESEVTKGGDTSTNKPGNSIGTEVISPGEGGSDDNSDGPKVLQSNPPLRPVLSQNYFGTILRYYFLAGAEIVPRNGLCDRKKKICLSTIFC